MVARLNLYILTARMIGRVDGRHTRRGRRDEESKVPPLDFGETSVLSVLN